MSKLSRYGFIYFIILLVGIMVFTVNAQEAFAIESEEDELEQTSLDADKKAAIDAANQAIRRIPSAENLRFLDPLIEKDIARARALVDTAIEDYGASETDFRNLSKLKAVEWQLERLEAIQAAKDAMDAIPAPAFIAEEHREIIEEARRLADLAAEVYGATDFELCYRLKGLIEAEKRLPEQEEEPEPEPEPEPELEPEPEPEPEPVEPEPIPTPPTGGTFTSIVSGLLLTGAGLMFLRKRF